MIGKMENISKKIDSVYNYLFKFYHKFEKLDYINQNLTIMMKVDYD